MELKKCPFCGGEAKLMNKVIDSYAHMWITCNDCGAAGPIFSCNASNMPRRASKDEPMFRPVYEAWNKRA